MLIQRKGMIKMKENFTIDELKDMTSEVNCWNGGLDYLDYLENDEYFFDDYFKKPIDAVRAVYYGDYNFMDDYVRFNAYGNLDSCSEYEYEKKIEDNAEEIIDAYYENINEMTDNELKNKV